jgi:hypothetical protein
MFDHFAILLTPFASLFLCYRHETEITKRITKQLEFRLYKYLIAFR